MTKLEIALLEILTVSSVGIILFVLAFVIKVHTDKNVKSCSMQATGRVEKHIFTGGGRMYPVAEFNYQGKTYYAKRVFQGYITKQRHTPGDIYTDRGAYVNENDMLVVPVRMVTDFGKMAEKLWPVGSDMKVFFNPDNPAVAYAEKLPRKIPLLSRVYFIGGIVTIVFSLLMGVLIYRV